MCLANKVSNSRAISLNGGAAATNPVLTGPGPSKAVFYHIFGDLVSTHMSPNAATVIRVAKPDRKFGVIYPHSSARFLASDGTWVYATADDEDDVWRKFGYGITAVGAMISPILSFVNYMRRMRLPATSPIPGSRRFNSQSWW